MNKCRLKTLALWLAVITSPSLMAVENCSIENLPHAKAADNTWITKRDWLAPENLRYGLANMQKFMPVIKVASLAPAKAFKKAAKPLDLQTLTAPDPVDQQSRSVAFLLNSRLYADGVLVLRNGTLLFEDYSNGLSVEQPRMLLSATRPVMAILAAISTAQGKLQLEKALSNNLPELSSMPELRKISLHRLLNEPAAFRWSQADMLSWRHVSGWDEESPQGNIRTWIKTVPFRFAAKDQPGTINGPDGQLLVWAMESAWKRPVPSVFCERLFSLLHPEHPAYWATDNDGDPLADGLALSLRDFGRLGMALAQARGSFKGTIPSWFAESIASPSGSDEELPVYLSGLKQGSQVRYGFINQGGRPHRAAAIGAHGNSVFIDFDRRLVIAIFASYPAERSPLMLRTLSNVWEAIGSAATKSPH